MTPNEGAFYKLESCRDGELTQRLKVLSDFSEDLGSILCTYVMAHNHL
jgi:hypothetical protein